MRPLSSALFAFFALVLLAAPGAIPGTAPGISPAAAAEPAQSLAADSAEQAMIRRVIESQIAAFQRDDGPAAYAYAAPALQRLFQTPEIFMEMVRSGYGPVYRPREFEFRELRQRGNNLYQEVLFVGPDGEPVLALYTMEQQADGSWRIAGVIFLAAPDRMT